MSTKERLIANLIEHEASVVHGRSLGDLPAAGTLARTVQVDGYYPILHFDDGARSAVDTCPRPCIARPDIDRARARMVRLNDCPIITKKPFDGQAVSSSILNVG